MHRVISSALCVPADQFARWLHRQGAPLSAMDDAVQQRYVSGLSGTVPATSRKRPRVSAILSDSSNDKAW